jgi:hypothetical protein
MSNSLVESGVELALLAIETVLFGTLTTLGLLSEQAGLSSLSGGETLGLWYVYMGGVALYAGVYALGYRRLLPRVRRRLNA